MLYMDKTDPTGKRNVGIRLSPPALDYLNAYADELARRSLKRRSLGETVEYALYKLAPPTDSQTLQAAHRRLRDALSGGNE